MLLDGKIFVPDSEFEWQFMLSSGPGGQNVNKVSSAVRLTFDIAGSLYLPDALRQRLLAKLPLSDGKFTVTVRDGRTQFLNRREAMARLERALNAALVVPKVRRATKPTRGSVQRRLASKKRNSQVKRDRGVGGYWGDE